tara:strand:+ start:65 stop:595 length:531 start_codon:yes stop_codon:yes gene_type:complete
MKNYVNKKGYVYLITDPKKFFIKIGLAKNVKKRLAGLQAGNPIELKVLDSFSFTEYKAARAFETHLLRFFGHKRVRGEWFANLNNNDLETIHKHYVGFEYFYEKKKDEKNYYEKMRDARKIVIDMKISDFDITYKQITENLRKLGYSLHYSTVGEWVRYEKINNINFRKQLKKLDL